MEQSADMSVCELDDTGLMTTMDATPPNFVFARDKTISTEDFNNFKEEIKSMITTLWKEKRQEIISIPATLKEIQQSTLKIENSMLLLTAQHEELSKKIIELEDKSKKERDYIILLEEKIENLQMGTRKSNLEIKNVPRGPSETKDDLVQMVLCLSSAIGGTLTKTDIKDVYRVRGKKKESSNTPIVVETASTLIKTDILKLCKAFNTTRTYKLCAKHLGHRVAGDTPIFVSEQLTAKGARLHFLARDLVKAGKYKFCWTAYGRVYIRKSENSPIITIKSEAQVQQLFNSD
uniref:FP protein C-terminal domain-containing protein n=1 Tax=Heliothis virescens TaxID=7102 RepID=A0A2A4JIS1_HELVI